MVVKPDDGDSNSAQLVHLLKVENQALKEELSLQRRRVKDLEFDNAQLRHRSSQSE